MFQKRVILAAVWMLMSVAMQAQDQRGAKLEGTEWRLTRLGKAAFVHAPGAPEAKILLEDGRVSGSSGCNRLVGGYELKGRALHFTPGGMTRMACPEPAMKQETRFTDALASTTAYRIVNGKLELLSGTRVLADFVAASAAVDGWLGQWNGPEGTYLVLSKEGDKYRVKIRSLDGEQTFEGTAEGDRISFTRNGQPESIKAGNGTDTGMKWLLDKKNCLIVRTGEGFCRD